MYLAKQLRCSFHPFTVRRLVRMQINRQRFIIIGGKANMDTPSADFHQSLSTLRPIRSRLMHKFSEADRDGKPRTPNEEGRDVSTFPGSEEGPSMQPCRKARSDDKYLNFAGFMSGSLRLRCHMRISVQLRRTVRKPGYSQKKN